MTIAKMDELSEDTKIVAYCMYICQLVNAADYADKATVGAKV